nr:serine hydrolase domain-containing protein [Cyclobacteriaceae bacterium]
MKRIILLVSITITAWVGFVFYTTPDTPRKSLEKAENKTALPTPYLQMLDDYEGYISESLKLTGTPGAAITIVHDSTIIYLKGFGVKNVGTGEPVDVHTAFRLGSVSKSVTSVMVGAMVAAKALDWDEPVVKYLPHFELKSPAYTQ